MASGLGIAARSFWHALVIVAGILVGTAAVFVMDHGVGSLGRFLAATWDTFALMLPLTALALALVQTVERRRRKRA